MKLALVFPPLADPTQPYSSLPALAAYLRSRGHTEILQLDANIEFVRHVLTAEYLGAALDRLEDELARCDSAPSERSEADRYAVCLRALLKAPMVVAGIDSAARDLRRPEVFRDHRQLDRSMRLMHEALEILSAASFPYDMGFGNSGDPGGALPAELGLLAANQETNPFYHFLSMHTLPLLAESSPAAIGISITYRKQVLPAITLAMLIREHLEGVPVIFGGNVVSLWCDRIEEAPEVFDWCDYLVHFEGESALEALLLALERGGGFEKVPNLVYRQHGRIRKNPVIREDLDRLPTPDYGGLPLELYLAPQPVFLLSTSRGCYWSRCNFCSVSPAMRGRYRVRHPDLVHLDITTLRERHGAECISFADDCVAPSALIALVERLEAYGPRVSWQCEVRFEKALSSELLSRMKETGCVNLIFGLESYSPRVLQLMDKGIEHAQIARILADCRRVGIAFNLQFFFGFPGETEDEAQGTAEFVSAQMHGAATFSFGTFELQKGAPAERNPKAFNIEHVGREVGPLALKFDYAPVATHAAEIRMRLREQLRERLQYRNAGLSLNAHTLTFLHEAGVEALGEIYRRLPVEDSAPLLLDRVMDSRVRPGSHQSIRSVTFSPQALLGEELDREGQARHTFLLYDHDLDRIVEVPGVALWVLQHLDGTTTPSDLVTQLATEAETSTSCVLPLVRDLVHGLRERGFLVSVVTP